MHVRKQAATAYCFYCANLQGHVQYTALLLFIHTPFENESNAVIKYLYGIRRYHTPFT